MKLVRLARLHLISAELEPYLKFECSNLFHHCIELCITEVYPFSIENVLGLGRGGSDFCLPI